jgi:hypothetical protein
MKLSDHDFELLKSLQYCDDPSCSYYQKVEAILGFTIANTTYCILREFYDKSKLERKIIEVSLRWTLAKVGRETGLAGEPILWLGRLEVEELRDAAR